MAGLAPGGHGPVFTMTMMGVSALIIGPHRPVGWACAVVRHGLLDDGRVLWLFLARS